MEVSTPVKVSVKQFSKDLCVVCQISIAKGSPGALGRRMAKSFQDVLSDIDVIYNDVFGKKEDLMICATCTNSLNRVKRAKEKLARAKEDYENEKKQVTPKVEVLKAKITAVKRGRIESPAKVAKVAKTKLQYQVSYAIQK